ncbi:cell wall protein DAN1-like [Tribolium madens]|uniref:cell wall protein DAN1-like n=1 Tax=Tribolium madens TaxID=41895 RepID=UPI001CF75596|nr:cell wall protein DAN1-like [Tribolium madens]
MMIPSLLVVAAMVACSSADPIFGWYDLCQECPSSEEGDVFTETWCEWMCETIEEEKCATTLPTSTTQASTSSTTKSSTTFSTTSSISTTSQKSSQNESSTMQNKAANSTAT